MTLEGASPAERFIVELVDELGEAAPAALEEILAEAGALTLAGVAHDWRGFWARPQQLPPESRWRTCGIQAGRGFGKSRACAEFFVGEIVEGRARRAAITSKTADDARFTNVEGESGILAVCPPWFKMEYEPSNELVQCENGATIRLYTAEVAGGPNGKEHDLIWADEVSLYPENTAFEHWHNLLLTLRLGRNPRLIWSAAPRPVTPLLRYLNEKAQPGGQHIVIRGRTDDNALNLADDFVAERHAELDGTSRQGELGGDLVEETEGKIFHQTVIDANRAPAPDTYVEIAIAVDPAGSDRKGADETGIVVGGLGLDERAYIAEDLSGRFEPRVWAELVLDAVARALEITTNVIVIAETNRFGNYPLENMRSWRGDGSPRARMLETIAKAVHIIPVYGDDSKGLRASPVATAYASGRVSHVRGARLQELEQQMTGWIPGRTRKSPDRVDADVYVVRHLLRIDEKARPLPGPYKSVTAQGRFAKSARHSDDAEAWDRAPDD